MIFSSVSALDKRKSADVLILPFFLEADVVVSASDLPDDLLGSIWEPIGLGDFKAKESTFELLYSSDLDERRILLLGLGKKDELAGDKIRLAYAKAIQFCQKKKFSIINLAIPELGFDLEIIEGILLKNYSFEELKTEPVDSKLVEKIVFIGASKSFLKMAKQQQQIFEGVYLARDLINRRAEDVTPQYLAKVAEDLAVKHQKVSAKIFNRAQIEKLGMGLLVAVGKGAVCDPNFIMVEYKGDVSSEDKTALVGKGITFDSGGLNLKPTGHIEDMRSDMSGAAAVLGTISAAAKLGLKKNIIAVVPAAENSVGPASYKCGDVYHSYSGKSVEISNTDAEGRLILADALSYTCDKIKPSRIIDLATLTGAIVVSLGDEVSGAMGNNQDLVDSLKASGERTYERVWQMPLYKEFKSSLKSDIADIKNCGNRNAGSITAGLFLQEFVASEMPWVHLDIAGTAFLDEEKRYYSKNATGWGVRILIDFIHNL